MLRSVDTHISYALRPSPTEVELYLAASRLGSVSCQLTLEAHSTYKSSVHFPGAVDSKFVTKLDFIRPSTHASIPTYRVMDSDGKVLDKERAPSDVSVDEIISWYKNMVSGILDEPWPTTACS